jgi:hypothetical protein
VLQCGGVKAPLTSVSLLFITERTFLPVSIFYRTNQRCIRTCSSGSSALGCSLLLAVVANLQQLEASILTRVFLIFPPVVNLSVIICI